MREREREGKTCLGLSINNEQQQLTCIPSVLHPTNLETIAVCVPRCAQVSFNISISEEMWRLCVMHCYRYC